MAADGGDFSRFFVRNLGIKLFFQAITEAQRCQENLRRIFQRSVVGYFFLPNARLFADNFS